MKYTRFLAIYESSSGSFVQLVWPFQLRTYTLEYTKVFPAGEIFTVHVSYFA